MTATSHTETAPGAATGTDSGTGPAPTDMTRTELTRATLAESEIARH